MDQKKLGEVLADLPLGRVYYFPTTGSTNDLAADLVNAGTVDLTLVVAEEQTAGRGRGDRRWFSPPGGGLFFSLVLKPGPDGNPSTNPMLAGYNAMGALAVCETLERQFQLQTQIKWPNDVLVDNKKICGVLVEAKWLGDSLQAVILGVGVNVTPTAIPRSIDLDYPSSSIEDRISFAFGGDAELLLPVSRSELLHSILVNLLGWRELMGEPAFISAWESRLAYRGEQVVILHPDTKKVLQEGLLEGLNANGSLRLIDPENVLFSVAWGDLRLRPRNSD